METILHTPSQAHREMKSLWLKVKASLTAGRKLVINLEDYEESLTAQQRKFYHSYILTEIAKQARPNGNKFPMPVWKEYLRDMFLGDKVVNTVNPMDGTVKREVVRVSSESLGVKGYNRLIEQVTAYACTELNVNFNESFDTWMENEKN